MPVYELSSAGSVKTGRTLYTSMNAGNQYGAMVPIASSIATTSVVFSNIPQTFQDLMLVMSLRSNRAATTASFCTRINENTSGIGSYTILQGDGSSASSSRNTGATFETFLSIAGNTSTSGIFSSVTYHLLNYTNSSTFKTCLARSANDLNGSGTTTLQVGLLRSTSPVTSLQLFEFDGNSMISGSTYTLYGIRAVSS